MSYDYSTSSSQLHRIDSSLNDVTSDIVFNAQDQIDVANSNLGDTKQGVIEKVGSALFGVGKELTDILKEPLEEVFSIIGDLLASVSSEITDLISGGVGALSSAKNTLSSLGSIVIDEGKNLLDTIVDSGKDLVNNTISGLSDGFSGLVNGFIQSVKDALSSIGSTIGSALSNIGTSIKSGLDGAFDGLKGIFDGVVNKIKDLINPLIEEFSEFITTIKQGILEIGNVIGELFNFDVDEVATQISDINKRILSQRAEELLG